MLRAIHWQIRKIPALRNGRVVLGKLIAMARDRRVRASWRQRSQGRRRLPASPPNRDNLHIAFVTAFARAREVKLARAARLTGHRVTLLSTGVQFEDPVRDSFDAVHRADGPWAFLNRLEDVAPDVVHLFVNYNNFDMQPVLRFSGAPVVYDPYDCLRGMFRSCYQKDWIELRSEQSNFDEADHVCARSLEPLYLREHFGYRMPATTYFPDYCWRAPVPRDRTASDPDDLHVVYCGGIWPEDRYSSDEFGYAQKLETARVLASQKIHFHVYPAMPSRRARFEDFFSSYIKESESNPYFHFHRPIPYDQLIARLSDFDAALHVFGTEIDDNLGAVTHSKLEYSAANKLFDYIEAGLPVIMHRGTHQYGLVRHYGAAIQVDSLRGLRPALLASRDRMRDNRSGCDIAFHAPRLSRMYQTVALGRGSGR